MVTMSMNGVTLYQNRCIMYDTSRLDQLKIIKQAIAISKVIPKHYVIPNQDLTLLHRHDIGASQA